MSKRRLPFVLASCEHGSMIVNRLDYHTGLDANNNPARYGVGHTLLDEGQYCDYEAGLLETFAKARRQYRGDGVCLVDVGANIGAVTVPLARALWGWGNVVAIEAQEWAYYALAGNLAINNLFNARALHAAAGAEIGTMQIPVLNPSLPASFGSLEIRPTQHVEPIGQPIDYERGEPITVLTIDGLNLPRVDVLKIDVEGMEIDVLKGARQTIERHQPILLVERIKVSGDELASEVSSHGYDRFHEVGLNLLAIHPDDPTRKLIKDS